jgi:hypothetical protein
MMHDSEKEIDKKLEKLWRIVFDGFKSYSNKETEEENFNLLQLTLNYGNPVKVLR